MKYSILTIAALPVLMAACHGHTQPPKAELAYSSVDSMPMLIMQVRKCSRLHTAEYNIHKIVTHDDVVRLKGKLFDNEYDIKMPFGDRKIAIPINARLKAYIDFSQFSEKNISRHGNKITVTLPDPKVVLTSSKVDRAGIKEYVSVTRSGFSDAELTSYEQQGRRAIIESIPQLGIVETARENAANVLIPMIAQMGYKESDITITFRKDFSPADVNLLYDKGNNEK